MSIVIFLPILILLAILLGAGAVLTKLKIWKPKRTFYFAVIYIGLGVFSFIGLLVMHDKTDTQASEEELQQLLVENDKLSQQLKYRNYGNLKPEHLKFTKTFEATAEDIEINYDSGGYRIRTVVAWNDSTSNEIEVSYYETPLYFNRMNISDLVKPPTIKLVDNQLVIHEPETDIKVKSASISLMMLDLENNPFGDDRLGDLIGLRILHLNVPRHFNIIDNSGWIE